MNLSVGQIVFVIPEKQTAVHPMQVIEEITKRMLHLHPDGRNEVVSETDYLLKSISNSKNLLSSEINGEIFESAEKAKSTMIERATMTISRHIENAVKKANDAFGMIPAQTSFRKDEIVDESAYIDLGNGIKGRVRISE